MSTATESAMRMPPIIRAPLRQEIRRVILERILRGALPPGSDLNEAMLAASLGVSRTPLREALLGLEMEGFLKSDVGRGFSVVPLTERDVEEIYPLLWTLESLALRTMGPVPADKRRRLADLNAQLESSAADAEASLALDQSWHETLLSQCHNQHLLDLLRGLKDLAHRYELAYMKHSGKVILSVEQHRGVLSALERGDVEDAAAHLEANWRVSQEFLIPWIQGQGAPDARRKTPR